MRYTNVMSALQKGETERFKKFKLDKSTLDKKHRVYVKDRPAPRGFDNFAEQLAYHKDEAGYYTLTYLETALLYGNDEAALHILDLGADRDKTDVHLISNGREMEYSDIDLALDFCSSSALLSKLIKDYEDCLDDFLNDKSRETIERWLRQLLDESAFDLYFIFIRGLYTSTVKNLPDELNPILIALGQKNFSLIDDLGDWNISLPKYIDKERFLTPAMVAAQAVMTPDKFNNIIQMTDIPYDEELDHLDLADSEGENVVFKLLNATLSDMTLARGKGDEARVQELLADAKAKLTFLVESEINVNFGYCTNEEAKDKSHPRKGETAIRYFAQHETFGLEMFKLLYECGFQSIIDLDAAITEVMKHHNGNALLVSLGISTSPVTEPEDGISTSPLSDSDASDAESSVASDVLIPRTGSINHCSDSEEALDSSNNSLGNGDSDKNDLGLHQEPPSALTEFAAEREEYSSVNDPNACSSGFNDQEKVSTAEKGSPSQCRDAVFPPPPTFFRQVGSWDTSRGASEQSWSRPSLSASRSQDDLSVGPQSLAASTGDDDDDIESLDHAQGLSDSVRP